MPHLLVVIVEALPMLAELFEAGLVDVFNPGRRSLISQSA